MAARPINKASKRFSGVITETNVGTPAVAAESAERIVGQWEEWRKRPITDLKVRSAGYQALEKLFFDIPCNCGVGGSGVLLFEESEKNNRQGYRDKYLN